MAVQLLAPPQQCSTSSAGHFKASHLLRLRQVCKAGGIENVRQVGQHCVVGARHGADANQAAHSAAVQRGQQQADVAACGEVQSRAGGGWAGFDGASMTDVAACGKVRCRCRAGQAVSKC